MPAELIAILSAMGWATDSILVRLGARRSSILAAALLSYAVAAAVLWSYLASYVPLSLLFSFPTVYFVAAGCLQPLFARVLFYIGLTRLGASRAAPLRGSEPLFSTAIAVAFLHERPKLSVYGGTLLIVAGVWLLSWRRSGESAWRPLDLSFPLGAALVAAVSQNLRRRGLHLVSDPVFGATVSTTTSLVLFSLYLGATRTASAVRIRRESAPFFAGAALAATAAQLMNFIALSRGEVSTIVPLLNTTPLFTLLLSGFFLRGIERVTPALVAGALLMTAGVIVIAAR